MNTEQKYTHMHVTRVYRYLISGLFSYNKDDINQSTLRKVHFNWEISMQDVSIYFFIIVTTQFYQLSSASAISH